MDKTKVFVYILFILFEVFTMGLIMETYKKVIRKDEYKNWECKLLGLLLSTGATGILICSDLIYPVFSTMFNADLWLDHLTYIVVFYILQLKYDTIVFNKLLRSFVAQWLKSNIGISLDELQIVAKMYKADENHKK